jgi:NAD(P)-dependent dehydrogenase (short-subunit alcohol dehydrogenase family)
MSLEKFRLAGYCALVTGGSKGLGRSMAKALASAGADIILTSRHLNEAKAAADEIAATGRRALALEVDVAERSAVAQMVRRGEEAFGKIDILVNNAGLGIIKPALEVGDDEWDPVIATNLKGSLLCAQAVAPGMMSRGYGRIINVGSILSAVSMPAVAGYVASKHGVLGLTRALALEWAAHGITVNCLCPSYFPTAMTRSVEEDPVTYQMVIAKTPMGRWGRPDELDGPIIFLASPASSFITGTALYVDGGWTAH